jgi:translation initiation factor IF-3
MVDFSLLLRHNCCVVAKKSRSGPAMRTGNCTLRSFWPMRLKQPLPEETSIARPPAPPTPPSREGPRVNDEIRIPQVRLIDQTGEMQGVMSTREAIARAFAVGLDLVEISPNAEPPVAKILDYGKFKYEQQKKRNEARKKQKIVEIKEVKVRPNIDENDYQVKLRAMKGFIEEGDKVKVTLRFRGREMAHQELGVKVLERIRADMDVETKVEQMPKMENRQMVMVLTPR